MLSVNKIKKDFPIFKRKINGKNLIYLDSAATSQKPRIVIKEISDYYEKHNANINRGIHTLGDESTRLYESSRDSVAKFINSDRKEIIFVRNATEGINLVARSFVIKNVKHGDFILLTDMEHHANLIPWQILAKKARIRLEFVPVNKDGILDINSAKKLLAKKPKFFAFSHVSNVLGTINPIKQLIGIAHSFDVPVLVDAAQSLPHMKIDVKDLDCDFLVFSAHKMLGPTGVGVLYGKYELLKSSDPFLGGGDMVKEAYFDHFVPDGVPIKFEAGTPSIADVVAFKSSIDYLKKLGMENVQAHDKLISSYAFDKLSKIKNVTVYGPKDISLRSALVSFNVFTNDGILIHPHDIATILDGSGIAIRAGHHCCMPLHLKMNLAATCRASFYIYNSKNDVGFLVKEIIKIQKLFDGSKVKNE